MAPLPHCVWCWSKVKAAEMKPFNLSVPLLCGMLALRPAVGAPTPSNEPPAVTARILRYSPEGPPVYKAVPLTRADLAGEYQKRMIGDTDFLKLRSDGSYRLENWSCGGMTGAQSGRWMLDRAGLRFSIRQTQGGDRKQRELWQHRLEIVGFGSRYLLVPSAFPDRILRYGLEPHRFLHQEAIRDEISKDHVRRLSLDFERSSR